LALGGAGEGGEEGCSNEQGAAGKGHVPLYEAIHGQVSRLSRRTGVRTVFLCQEGP
jgi:hypothetical protein